MATRLCCRKRRRMLQHFAPATSATPSSDLVQPLHRSVSHSCPAYLNNHQSYVPCKTLCDKKACELACAWQSIYAHPASKLLFPVLIKQCMYKSMATWEGPLCPFDCV